jgi:hypothetical protein
MKTITLQRIDLSIVVSVTAALVLFTSIVPSPTFGRIVAVFLETAWRYLSNASG